MFIVLGILLLPKLISVSCQDNITNFYLDLFRLRVGLSSDINILYDFIFISVTENYFSISFFNNNNTDMNSTDFSSVSFEYYLGTCIVIISYSYMVFILMFSVFIKKKKKLVCHFYTFFIV